MSEVSRGTTEPVSAVYGTAADAGRPIGSRCRASCHRPSRRQAHCAVCHRTFAGVSYFDRHRRDGRCIVPADLGLVHYNGFWTTPAGAAQREQATALLGELRRR